MDVKESDWKLFRKKLPKWQESYMESLVREYIELLNTDLPASSKFWELEKRLKVEKEKPGVLISPRRSMMYTHILELIQDGAITMDDLFDFSNELKDEMSSNIERIIRS